MVTHVVSQQSLCGKSLGTMRALEALPWDVDKCKKVSVMRDVVEAQRRQHLGEGYHPRQKGTTQAEKGSLGNYGWTQHHGKSMGHRSQEPELESWLHHLLVCDLR